MPPLVIAYVLAVADPQILWLTCGNVTNRNLRQLLTATLPDALEHYCINHWLSLKIRY